MKLIHFTDSHVQTIPPTENQFSVQPLWQGDVRELFVRLAAVTADADALVFSGDATHGGRREAVEYFFDLLALASHGKPVFIIMGNHDVTDPNFAEHFRDSARKYPNVQFRPGLYPVGDLDLILVDNEYLSPAGLPVPFWRGDCFPVPALSEQQLAEMDIQLSINRTRPAVMVIHCPTHAGPPVLVDSGHPILQGMEQYQRALHALLARHPRVQRVLSGHIHFNSTARFDHRIHHSLGSVVEHPYPVRLLEGPADNLVSRVISLQTPADSESGQT